MSREIIQDLHLLIASNLCCHEKTESLDDLRKDISPVDIVRAGPRQTKCTTGDVLWILDQSWEEIKSCNYENGLEYAQVSLDHIWERLNTGYWKNVDRTWREMYTVGSLLKAFCLVGRSERNEEIFNCCDMGLLMGAPVLDNILAKVVNLLNKGKTMEGSCILESDIEVVEKGVKCDNALISRGEKRKAKEEELLNCLPELQKEKNVYICKSASDHDCKRMHDNFGNSTCNSIKEKPTDHSAAEQGHATTFKMKQSTTVNSERSIPRVSTLSLEAFQFKYMLTSTPIIIENSMKHWPAMSDRRWSVEYLKEKAGLRTVPVEIGERYTSDDWTQKLLTINDFIDRFINNKKGGEKGYLAQHQLFDQIPELRADICIPDYCCLGDDNEEDDDVIINAWFGPQGTLSPLHQDPYHNIFAQVVGQKYIRLYNELYSDMVYPHVSTILDNTSQVDVENPDLDKFPLFAEAPYLECILKEGEMLYIPKKCWHYVRSLSLSFSVSFWWS